MKTRTCPVCGAEFATYNNKFCSVKCMYKGRKTHGYSLEYCQNLAVSRGGECLSIEYKNHETGMKWKCREGHLWTSPLKVIHKNCWCTICSGKKLTIIDCKKTADVRGFSLLSEKYIGSKEKLQWKCSNNHVWLASLNNIRCGSGCPYCKNGASSIEEKCREIFEEELGCKFPQEWPEWLVNPSKNRLQLDGYCKELSLAFEYDGEFHYSKHYKSNESDFLLQQLNDKYKTAKCKEHNVKLIRIPFWEKKNLKSFIEERLGDS